MGFRVTIKKKSAWDFDTFGGGGLSVGFFAGTGGKIVMSDPSGTSTDFYYGGIGAGLSAGLKLPKIGKLQINTPKGALTGAGGPTAFPSTGQMYVTNNFSRDELRKSDIQGICAFVEVGGGLVVGGSAIAMLVDLNPIYLPLIMAPGAGIFAQQLFMGSAKGLLLMAGLNVGIQAQIGGAAFIGGLG